MTQPINLLISKDNNSYFSQGFNLTKKYLKIAVGCIPAVMTLAIPLLLSAALPITAGSLPYEERNTELAIPTPQSTAVGFLADAAIGAVQMTFLLGGVLGAAAHVNRPLASENFPPVEMGENLSDLSSSSEPKLKGKFIHIPQIHWVNGVKMKPKHLERIWQSQIRVLEKLLLYPDAAIFHEGWTEKSTDNLSSIKQKIQKTFSQGIPKDPQSWSQTQKRLFAKYGAAKVLYCLDLISEIHPTVNAQMGREMSELRLKEKARKAHPCDRERVERVFAKRESALIYELKYFLSQPENQDREILIVYGARHNFTKYFEAGSFKRLTNEPPGKPCPLKYDS